MSKPMFSVRFDPKRVKRFLKDIERQAPFATAVAMTNTAREIKTAEVAGMQAVFDRPTRFTLNSLFVRAAKKNDLVAEVDFKQGFGSIPAYRYLGPQVEGGERAKKRHERALERMGILRSDEYAVPGAGLKLDPQGNIRGGEITRILSQLGAAETSGYAANITARSRRRSVRRARGRYFVYRGGSAPAGVYRRSGQSVMPVLIFVRSPRYTERLPFYRIAREVVRRRYVPNIHAAWRRYGPKPKKTITR